MVLNSSTDFNICGTKLTVWNAFFVIHPLLVKYNRSPLSVLSTPSKWSTNFLRISFAFFTLGFSRVAELARITKLKYEMCFLVKIGIIFLASPPINSISSGQFFDVTVHNNSANNSRLLFFPRRTTSITVWYISYWIPGSPNFSASIVCLFLSNECLSTTKNSSILSSAIFCASFWSLG